MMRTTVTVLAGLASALGFSQSVSSVYNRDTHEPFRLKKVSVESTVIGPMVRTSTWLTYENPYKTLTEATLNFDMPEAAALGGFAYLYGDEYVRGTLMDKNKAWFIYTAITSRNRDPGIMEQWSPTNYHCQIFPIKTGSDLRVRLWTVGMLQPSGDKMTLPKPSAPRAVGYEAIDPSRVKPEWTVRLAKSAPLKNEGDLYSVGLSGPVSAIAQKFRDGRVYVAGLIRTSALNDGKKHRVEILKARYEPANGETGGGDVTSKVAELVNKGIYSIKAETSPFGDTAPWKITRLRVTFRVDGIEHTETVAEHRDLTLLGNAALQGNTTFFKLSQPKTVLLDDRTVAFSGWMPRNRQMAARFEGIRYSFKPKMIGKGSDTARLWAQQMLANNTWMRVKDVLSFSLKYGVPSTATALLAVPSHEMKLFRAKEKEFEKAEAEKRRQELQAERRQRVWARGGRNQNWNSSGGGDPEIRVQIPHAKSVDAILPDRRVLSLRADGDTWGGNFEIPADAAEGTYTVRVVAHMVDGSTVERSWTYDVDRTPPKGQVEFVTEGLRLVLQVKSEPGLAEVAVYAADGTRWVLREERPGVYRVELPSGIQGSLTVVLKDLAGNKGELHCSPPR